MEGSCYNFSSDALNWTAAKSACEALGSNLVVINSRDEQQAIAAKVSQRTWIGLYRNPKNTSRWLWVDGSPVNYTNWARGEPNSPNSEECGEMYPNGKWNDKECYAPRPFVCETRVPTCPALTVGSLVKTSPNTCATSQMNYDTKCLFSCPQGYQLQGPAYKQCGANGQWTDSAKSVSCSVVKCPALTVGFRVKTSPNSCVTSQMRINSTCSFSCPQVYQQQGPSYTQCGANGQWTHNAKAVSCTMVWKTWKPEGCFKEAKKQKKKLLNRKFAKVKGINKKNPDIAKMYYKCKAKAVEKGYEIFAIRGVNKCFTSSDGKLADYRKYGKSSKCKTNYQGLGVGIKRANYVFTRS
ncbi:hypothetical protein ACROYT_G026441 [Oculina patagonica]